MPITRDDVDEVYDADGLVSSETVVRDVTDETNKSTLREHLAAALAANRTYVKRKAPSDEQTAAQVRALTVQVNKLIRSHLALHDGTD